MNEEAIFNVYRRWHPWIKCIFIFGENYKYFAFFYPFFVYYDPYFPSNLLSHCYRIVIVSEQASIF